MPHIILATSSPHREEAFRFLGLDFLAHGSDVDEGFEGRPHSADELVRRLAKMKADAVSELYASGIVIGFDSVGCYNGQVLEKPRSRAEAFQRLRYLAGNAHQFYTGLYMINAESGEQVSRVVVTDVEMRDVTDTEIKRYLDQDEHFNTYALGYDPLGHYSATFVRKIEGSYNNFLRGIPLEVIVEMLPEVGYHF